MPDSVLQHNIHHVGSHAHYDIRKTVKEKKNACDKSNSPDTENYFPHDNTNSILNCNTTYTTDSNAYDNIRENTIKHAGNKNNNYYSEFHFPHDNTRGTLLQLSLYNTVPNICNTTLNTIIKRGGGKTSSIAECRAPLPSRLSTVTRLHH